MGRTGTLHACEQEGVAPDLMIDRQGPGRRLPADRRGAGAASGSSTRWRAGSGFFQHGHTYLGHPVACAAALAVQQVIERDGLLASVRARGRRGSRRRLHARFGDHPHVGDIRGRGLFCGDRAGRRPRDQGAVRSGAQAARAGQARGDGARPDVLSDGRDDRRRAGRPRAARAAVHRRARRISTHIVERLARGDRRGDRSGLELRLSHSAPRSRLASFVEETCRENRPHSQPCRRVRRGRARRRRLQHARRRAAEVHHHRHRRRHRRLLRGRRRDLPAGQQGPRQARHPLLGRVDRRLGVQHQHDQGGRARHRLRAVRRAVQRRQGPGPVQGRRRLRRPARGVLACTRSRSRCVARKEANVKSVRRLQGQALQRRQPGLGHARVDGRAARRDGLEARATSRSPPS